MKKVEIVTEPKKETALQITRKELIDTSAEVCADIIEDFDDFCTNENLSPIKGILCDETLMRIYAMFVRKLCDTLFGEEKKGDKE